MSYDLNKQIDNKTHQIHHFITISEHLCDCFVRDSHWKTRISEVRCSMCVPKIFTEIDKTNRTGTALDFISWYNTELEEFLNRIVLAMRLW